MERSRASPRSGRSKSPTDAARPWGGVTRKGEPSGPGYAGHILCMCRRPLCPFLCCMKFLLIKRLMCPVCRFSGFTGGEMNFHKCSWNCRVFCGNNSTLWISPPFSRLTSRVNFHIAWSGATHGGKLCGVRAADGWGKYKRNLERRTVPDFFSAAIHRCAINKCEHVLCYQNLKVRHL